MHCSFLLFINLDTEVIVLGIDYCIVFVCDYKEGRAVVIWIYFMVKEYSVIVFFLIVFSDILVMGKVEAIDVVAHLYFQTIANVQGVITFIH